MASLAKMDPSVMQKLPIFVFNGGSSSIKFSVFLIDRSLTLIYDGEASDIGTPTAKLTFYAFESGNRQPIAVSVTPEELGTFQNTIKKIIVMLDQLGTIKPLAIGHRVVHSGANLVSHQQITQEVLSEIKQSIPFAPLHQPIALEIIQEAMHHFSGVANFACFDTIFHRKMPDAASIYPLPKNYRDKGLRRYGFHGLSGESVLQQFRDIPERLIIAHLGRGASVTAVRDGTSVDTTMGLTPCGGILMGTRSGDLDPGLFLCLLRMHEGQTVKLADALEQLLNNQSGLLALSGLSNDMRQLRKAEAIGNAQATIAIEAFVLSVKKAIGGFIALLGGVDAFVFTGGIGEHDALTRLQICTGLSPLGITFDPKKNEGTQLLPQLISQQDSKTPVYVMPAEENRMIAVHVKNMLLTH